MAENTGQSFAEREAARMAQMNVFGKGGPTPEQFAKLNANASTVGESSGNTRQMSSTPGLRKMTSEEKNRIDTARANLTGDAAKQYQAALEGTKIGVPGAVKPIESPRSGQNVSQNTQNALNKPTISQSTQDAFNSINQQNAQAQYNMEQYRAMSGEQLKLVGEQIAELQRNVRLTADYGEDMGGRFGQLLDDLNRSQEVYSQKLTELSQKNFSSKQEFDQAKADLDATYQQERAIAEQQGIPDREVDWSRVKANLGFGTVPSTGLGSDVNPTPAVSNTVAADQAKLERASTATDFADQVFTGSSVEQFKGTSLNSYDAIMADIEALTMAGINQDNGFWAEYMDNMKRRSALVEAERDAAIARAEETGKVLLSKAEAQKEASLKANELAAKRDLARRDDTIEIQRDNLSRYQGFLQAKFEAAGMADSSAGLQLIGKYQAAADMQLRYAVEDRSDAQAMYLSRSEQIMSNYFDQAYEIEFGVADQKRESFFAAEKSLLEIDSNVLQATDTKQKNTLSALKELANAKMSAEQTKRAEIMQLQQMALEESKFEHQKIQDQIKSEQWEKQFGFSAYTFEKSYGLDVKKFEEDTRRFGLNYAMQAQDQAFRHADADRRYELDYTKFLTDDAYRERAFAQNVEQWEQEFQLTKDKFVSQENQRAVENLFAMATGDNPSITSEEFTSRMAVLAPDLLGSMLTRSTSVGNVSYGDESFVDRVSQAEANADIKRAQQGDGYQCVQFARDIIGDLPIGLNTMDDKRRILLNTPNTVDFPTPGAVFLENIGSVGHVGVVTSVDAANGTFTVSEFNYPEGKLNTTRKISIEENNMEGYWLSPKLGYDKTMIPTEEGQQGVGDMIKGIFAMATGQEGGQELLNAGWGKVMEDQGQIWSVDNLSSIENVNPAAISKQQQTYSAQDFIKPSGFYDAQKIDSVYPGLSEQVSMLWTASIDATNADTSTIRTEAMEYLAEGNLRDFDRLLTKTVVGTMQGAEQKRFNNTGAILENFDDAISRLSEVDSNLYKRMLETDAKTFLAQDANEDWVRAMASTIGSMSQERKELVGVAVTEPEMATYAPMFPDPSKDTAVTMINKLKALKSKVMRERQVMFNQAAGEYKNLYTGVEEYMY